MCNFDIPLLSDLIELFSFKFRMLQDAGMTNSQYIHDAFQIQVVTAQYIFLYLSRQVFRVSINIAHGLPVDMLHLCYISDAFMIHA